MRVVIAPDSFKGTVTAAGAAGAIARGWAAQRPGDETVLLPQADGGEGTLDALEAATPGSARRAAGLVTGPDGRPVVGEWLELPDGTAVVELAQMSGLPLMRRLDPLGASSRGLGEVIAAALDAGARRLIVALGGSASTDAGLPVLDALGDRVPPPGGAILLTDVDAPLLGPRGAAAVFGPQKGADRRDVEALEARLRAAVARLGRDPRAPGAGAAGGVGYGLGAWGARIESGSRYVAELTGLPAAVAGAGAVLTGEGRFDGQSLGGKVVGNALELCRRTGVPRGVIAGAVERDPGCWSAALIDLAGSVEAALAEPERWLEVAGREAALALGG
jgi:glycerate kinase